MTYYNGEAANVYDGQGNKSFVSEYAKECRRIGAAYLKTLNRKERGK